MAGIFQGPFGAIVYPISGVSSLSGSSLSRLWSKGTGVSGNLIPSFAKSSAISLPSCPTWAFYPMQDNLIIRPDIVPFDLCLVDQPGRGHSAVHGH